MLYVFLIVLSLTVSSAAAGVGYLGVYSDAEGTSCQLTDVGNALVTTYVVHRFFIPNDQATGSRFAIEGPTNATWQFLAYQSAFTTVGSALTDISVSYGTCISTTTNIGTVLWFSVVPVPFPCGFVSLKAASTVGTMLISDCSFTELIPISSYPLYVNPTPTCNCWGATEPATWGKVKALYR